MPPHTHHSAHASSSPLQLFRSARARLSGWPLLALVLLSCLALAQLFGSTSLDQELGASPTLSASLMESAAPVLLQPAAPAVRSLMSDRSGQKYLPPADSVAVASPPVPHVDHIVLVDELDPAGDAATIAGAAAADAAARDKAAEHYESLYPCLASDDAHIPLLYQMAFDFDEVFTAANVPFTIADGTLLGAERHKGIIPWDDDVDVMVLCNNPTEPCWSQLFDPQSRLRRHLRARDLDVYVTDPDSKRWMLKVYSTKNYLARHPVAGYTFPNLDVFLCQQVRCNVSDSLDAADWWERVDDVAKHPEKREEHAKALQVYETEIWQYHYRAGSRPHLEGKGCSVLDRTFDFMMVKEIFPQRRYQFGELQLLGPASSGQFLARGTGRLWAFKVHRSSAGHMGAELELVPKDSVRLYSSEGTVRPPPSRPHPPFKPCQIDLRLLPKADVEWITRPAAPMKIKKRKLQENKINTATATN